MSVESIARVLQIQGLKPLDKLMLVGIANHDSDGGAWPSVATLARYIGRTERTAHASLKRLVQMGLVSVERNAGGNARTRNDRRPNLYHLHLSTGALDGVQPDCGSSDSRGATSTSTGCNQVAPEPFLEPSTIESPTDLNARALGGVGEFDKQRKTDTANEYARLAIERARSGNYKIGNLDAYTASKVALAMRHTQIDNYLGRWPTAPASAIAAWLHGDKHSMSYYPEIS